ncbi:suppressor of glycerol defect, partial [Linderina pennispora]
EPKKPVKKPVAKQEKKEKKKTVDDRTQLTKFAKKNQGLYEMLRDSNLIENVDKEAGIQSKGNPADDLEDRELRRLERNLGIKKGGKLENAFFNEGLGELFDGIEFGSKDIRVAAAEKKPEATPKPTKSDAEDDGSESESTIESESEGESLDDDSGDDAAIGSDLDGDEDDDMFGLNNFGSDMEEDEDDEDSDVAEMYRSQGINVNVSLSDAEMDDLSDDSEDESEDDLEDVGEVDESEVDASEAEESDSDESDVEEGTKPEETKQPTSVTKYIPPSLRRRQASDEDERTAAIRKVLQGQLNRLSESNIEGIIGQIEEQYQKHPRHHVTEVLTGLLLQSIRSRIHMLDTFLYVNAALVGAIYRAIGLEPVAHLVQKLMEEYDKRFELGLEAFRAGEDDTDEGSAGKECQNLTVYIAELYNFQVISCQLVYDVIRMCIQDINEFSAELLLKIIRVSGIQLRKDDPLALKEIVQKVSETVNSNSDKFSVRCKFMVESLINLKDNRMRQTMSQNAENVVKLKRFLGNMDKRRAVGAAEPINIGLQDIRDIETKGKWWLVGASWVGNQVGTESTIKQSTETTSNAEMERLLKMAKEQHMNTDVRRSIFVTLLSSDDYADAFERLLKLDLKKTQVREVIRVLLHCCGQEKAYNPFYALVAFKLCSYHNSYRLTMQYALWDFLREMGETDVGGLGRINTDEGNETDVPLRRIVNVAKLYAWLIDKQVLSLLILKTVTFAKVGHKARVFFQILFSTLFLLHKKQSDQDVEALRETFVKAVPNATMCQGIMFFFHHFVKDCALVSDAEKPLMRWGCKIAKHVFRGAAGGDSYDD